MAFELKKWVMICTIIMPSFGFCEGLAADNVTRAYSPAQFLKNYALSTCLYGGYSDKTVKQDLLTGLNAYKELGKLDIDAYNEAADLAQRFLAKNYTGANGEKIVIMKCVDFFHSQELDSLAQRYVKLRNGRIKQSR